MARRSTTSPRRWAKRASLTPSRRWAVRTTAAPPSSGCQRRPSIVSVIGSQGVVGSVAAASSEARATTAPSRSWRKVNVTTGASGDQEGQFHTPAWVISSALMSEAIRHTLARLTTITLVDGALPGGPTLTSSTRTDRGIRSALGRGTIHCTSASTRTAVRPRDSATNVTTTLRSPSTWATGGNAKARRSVWPPLDCVVWRREPRGGCRWTKAPTSDSAAGTVHQAWRSISLTPAGASPGCDSQWAPPVGFTGEGVAPAGRTTRASSRAASRPAARRLARSRAAADTGATEVQSIAFPGPARATAASTPGTARPPSAMYQRQRPILANPTRRTGIRHRQCTGPRAGGAVLSSPWRTPWTCM